MILITALSGVAAGFGLLESFFLSSARLSVFESVRWRIGGADVMFPPLRRHLRPMRPERAGRLWLAKLHEPMPASENSGDRDDAAQILKAAADAVPVPETEEQAASAP